MFEGDSVSLDADETRHLRDVLRLREGADISIFNGEGAEFLCRVDAVTKNSTTATVLKEIEAAAPESPLSLTLASVVIPGDKYDLIVQKAVELGVVHFVPLASIRCELKAKDLPKKLTRWRRIALDAAKQCGRARLMTIGEPREVTDFVDSTGSGHSRVFFSERDGAPLAADRTLRDLTAVIGPKGGWDDAELASARAAGFEVVTLGGRIMRAETAAIALTAILQHRFGDVR